MAGDTTSRHDFLSLGDDTDEDLVTGPSMLDKPDIKPGHEEPVIPSAPFRHQDDARQNAVRTAAAVGAGATSATAATKPGKQTLPAEQVSRNQAAYQKLKADRAQARAEKQRQRRKKKADPLEAKLTNIEKEQQKHNKKYAEGSSTSRAVFVIACLVMAAVGGVMFYMHGDQIIQAAKTTPWVLYVVLAFVMYGYANSR